jgi:hypothetical protein
MKKSALAAAALVAAATAGAASAAPSVEIRNAAVRVVVQPENRSDIEVDVYRPNPKLPLTIERFGDHVTIDGRITPWLMNCHGHRDGLHAFIWTRGDFSVSEFPQVLVRTPMDVSVSAGGVVEGSISRSHALELRHGGCGDWTVGNVDGRLVAQVSGVGDVHAGSSGTADLGLSGTGGFELGPVAQALQAHISGAGNIHVQSAGAADLDITGSGSVKTGPVSGGLSSHISGAGALEVANLDGPMSVQVSGVGSVHVPQGHVSHLEAHLSGAGSVHFGGVADSLEADVSGTGNVDVAKVTGEVEQHVSGIGSVHIGGR